MKRATAIFMMGGPGAGKTRTITTLFAGMKVVDCDKFKTLHSDYDPKNPSAVHEWSKILCARELATTMGAGDDFVYDSTGTNAEKMVSLIGRSQELGYSVTVVYVTCSLRTALERNAKRERTVDESIVREKHSTIATAFEIVSRYADKIQVVNNDAAGDGQK